MAMWPALLEEKCLQALLCDWQPAGDHRCMQYLMMGRRGHGEEVLPSALHCITHHAGFVVYGWRVVGYGESWAKSSALRCTTHPFRP